MFAYCGVGCELSSLVSTRNHVKSWTDCEMSNHLRVRFFRFGTRPQSNPLDIVKLFKCKSYDIENFLLPPGTSDVARGRVRADPAKRKRSDLKLKWSKGFKKICQSMNNGATGIQCQNMFAISSKGLPTKRETKPGSSFIIQNN